MQHKASIPVSYNSLSPRYSQMRALILHDIAPDITDWHHFLPQKKINRGSYLGYQQPAVANTVTHGGESSSQWTVHCDLSGGCNVVVLMSATKASRSDQKVAEVSRLK